MCLQGTSTVAEGATPVSYMHSDIPVHEAFPSVVTRATTVLLILFTSPSHIYQQLNVGTHSFEAVWMRLVETSQHHQCGHDLKYLIFRFNA